MGDKFDPEQPIKYLQYLHANNLYGWAMSRDLPIGNFKCMTSDELTDWKDLCEKESAGCTLEVDLEYPDELHDLHNGYPLAPENIIPPAPKTIEEIDEKIPKVSKLISTLNNKTNYVLHYKALLLYEKL